jgi:RimJ/RimL family protein N-acetyltransferase
MTGIGAPVELRTDRLLLRGWRAADRAIFAGMNADGRVMAHFPRVLAAAESNALVDRIEEHFTQHGFGLWAVDVPDVAPFIGFVGLTVPRFTTHFTPCVEVGWRLDPRYWDRGYATEGGRAALAFGFGDLQLQEIVSFTVPGNHRSRRVMERLGMVHKADDDFGHPEMTGDMKRHVLYRIGRPAPDRDAPV